MKHTEFVIIGGGSAGFSAIKSIREETKTSSVLWITNEDRLPYKRTHINKQIANGFSKEDFALINKEWLSENNIELLYDQALLIDSKHKQIHLASSKIQSYNKIIIATGNTPKEITIDNYPGINQVYTANQVEQIISKAYSSQNILIIGAGVEGVETASQLTSMGKKVTLLDSNTYLLKQFFNDRFSDLLKETVNKAGVQLMLGIKNILYDKTSKLFKIDDKDYSFDMLISTIGYSPNISLAKDSNINYDKGILVNEKLETSIKDIYAAGDVAQHPDGRITGLWHAAEQQGYIAGKNACGLNIHNKLPPFRMKTKIFDTFYFSVPPKQKIYEIKKEENENTVRELYYNAGKLEAALIKGDELRAKTYQKALLEAWSIARVEQEIPLR